jgi:hypothetical protein
MCAIGIRESLKGQKLRGFAVLKADASIDARPVASTAGRHGPRSGRAGRIARARRHRGRAARDQVGKFLKIRHWKHRRAGEPGPPTIVDPAPLDALLPIWRGGG